MDADEFELDDAQLEVVTAPADARLLVIAGAGQGKTEVVARRIGQLVQEDDLTASEEILVLSFSRAAVSAVRRRLDLRDVSAGNVRTFDSFASMLLIDGGVQPEGTFDARIRRATQFLRECEEVPHHIAALRHLVIDEIQDLVGDRADFVLAILALLDSDAGVTALGDPLQAVYDFVLEGSRSRTTSDEVLKALTESYGCRPISLGVNYRAKGNLPKRVVELGAELWHYRSDEAAARVNDLLLDLPDREEIDKWYTEVTPKESDKKTAVLCTTNADVLRVSLFLNEHSIPHTVRRQAQDFGAARWIASVVGHLPGPKERRSEVENGLKLALGEDEVDTSWKELKSAEGRTREFDSLNLLRVNSLVRARALPLTLTEPDLSSVIVSTIHRAKGLEFDTVFIVEPTYVPPGEDAMTRVRRDYVALSRARERIFKCRLPAAQSLIRQESRLGGRLSESVWRKRRAGSWTRAFEFQYGDIDCDRPASSGSVNALQVQENLRNLRGAGIGIRCELDRVETTPHLPSYLLYGGEALIGRTSESFNQTFATVFGWLDEWPQVVHGLSLVAVETIAGDPRISDAEGVLGSGFWLVPRIVGLARPELSRK